MSPGLLDVLVKALPALVQAADLVFSRRKMGRRKKDWVRSQLMEIIEDNGGPEAIAMQFDLPNLTEAEEVHVVAVTLQYVLDLLIEQAVRARRRPQ